jgi:nucleoside-diphosphate-sugar epimerase
VEDVAHAIVLAAEQEPAGRSLYNVGEAETPPMRARVEALAAAMGARLRWAETEEPLSPGFALLERPPNDVVLDTSRIRTNLGYTEITTEEGRLESTITWLRRSRALNRPCS